jgi:hypothetical protein
MVGSIEDHSNRIIPMQSGKRLDEDFHRCQQQVTRTDYLMNRNGVTWGGSPGRVKRIQKVGNRECSKLWNLSDRQWKTKEQRWEGCALAICSEKSNPLDSGDLHWLVADARWRKSTWSCWLFSGLAIVNSWITFSKLNQFLNQSYVFSEKICPEGLALRTFLDLHLRIFVWIESNKEGRLNISLQERNPGSPT